MWGGAVIPSSFNAKSSGFAGPPFLDRDGTKGLAMIPVQMSLLQSLIIYFISPLITVYVYLILAYVIMGWLVSFNVINLRNENVRQIYGMLEHISGFILRPIQRIVPSFGGLDFSPIIAFLGLMWFNDYLLKGIIYPLVG